MKKKFEAAQPSGGTYVIKIDQEGVFATVDNPEEMGRIRGEFRLRVGKAEMGRQKIYLPQFGLFGPGISLKGDNSGKLSVRGLGGTGHISLKGKQWLLELNFKAEVLYGLISRKLGYVKVADDVFNSPVERFNGRIIGTIKSSKKAEQSDLVISEGRIHLVHEEGGLGLIRSLLVRLKRTPLVKLGRSMSGYEDLQTANNPCHPSLVVNNRTLRVQPVGFRTSNTDTNPSGTSATRQFNAANTIWGKCCIQFDVQPIHIITDATLKTSSDYNAIMNSYTDPNADAIEVFFVDNNLTNVGGGVCRDGNTALAKIAITDNNVGNDNLLAHELGHALSGLHPGGTWAGWWTGDENSVLVPTGSPTVPNPDENTHWNCINADNPVISTLTTTCCLTHDITDHYVRDFPEHLGTEPAVAPPGRNFYSMSNLWNRTSSTPGGVTPDGRPEHQNPIRFNSDGTPYQNYMFAKVEAIVDLPPRDMEVKFYLKHPGSGGGAANINLLGSTPVPDSLRPGIPKTESFAWQLPTGTPAHSCMFAVIRSPSEPDQDVTGLHWNDWGPLIRLDNDFVQRNLDLEEYPAGNIYEGNSNKIWMSPIFIDFPFEKEKEKLPLFLEINASEAKRLVELAIEVPGRERHKISPGSSETIKLSTLVKSGQKLPLVLSAIIPGDAEIGETFSVYINPILEETPLIGYEYQIYIDKPHKFLGQILDIALAAYLDYADITGSEVADELAFLHRNVLKMIPRSPHRFLKWLAKNMKLFKHLTEELHKMESQKNFEVVAAFERFLDALSSSKDLFALSCYRDAVSRLQMLMCIIYLKSKPLSKPR